jgi:hypothetical protein
MNRKVFWGIFVVTQLLGALGVATGSPHGNPFGLLIALIFLFPGSLLCLPILDKLAIQTGVGPIIVVSFLVDIVCWYAFALAATRIQRKKLN